MDPRSSRPRKTDIVRKRTGCQNCKTKHTNALAGPALAPPPSWNHAATENETNGSFALPWALFHTSNVPTTDDLFQEERSHNEAVALKEISPERAHHPTPPSPSDDLVTVPKTWEVESQSASTASTPSPLGFAFADCQLSLPLEEMLVQHFGRNVIPSIPVALAFPSLFRQSSCFRSAVLALAASNLNLARPLTPDAKSIREVFDDKNIRLYYDTAVKGLQAPLTYAESHRGEELAGAALLLADHELEAGTALGMLNHATGLDAIAYKLDFAASAVPGLFKAWRMLRYDVRFMKIPTRRTYNSVDSFDASGLLDPQLAIRDILSRVWGIYARFSMEASYAHDSTVEGGSASEKAASWLMSVLGRACDHRNFRSGDFHKDTLTSESILQQCQVFNHRLDAWHQALCDHDMPVVNLSSDSDIMSGPTFETFIKYRFTDERKALDYLIYLVCRMGCSYLRSLFNTSVSSSATNALGKVILGIACGMNIHQRQQFTVFRIDRLLKMAASMSEGTNFIATAFDSLLPKVIKPGFSGPDICAWVYLKSSLELELRERRKGRIIRMTIDGTDDDFEVWQLANRLPVAVFGDYNGKGHFRDCYFVEYLG
ncbi:hypothetical protein LX36DRAFT_689530 [Colletotrichum falcatum]|nr:hypothetical protein LX36DRAFT_689530 [Colletotrichum falcatum]